MTFLNLTRHCSQMALTEEAPVNPQSDDVHIELNSENFSVMQFIIFACPSANKPKWNLSLFLAPCHEGLWKDPKQISTYSSRRYYEEVTSLFSAPTALAQGIYDVLPFGSEIGYFQLITSLFSLFGEKSRSRLLRPTCYRLWAAAW
jgi:hypothetical protein